MIETRGEIVLVSSLAAVAAILGMGLAAGGLVSTSTPSREIQNPRKPPRLQRLQDPLPGWRARTR